MASDCGTLVAETGRGAKSKSRLDNLVVIPPAAANNNKNTP